MYITIEFKNKNKMKNSNTINQTDINTVTRVIINTIARNMKAGASYEKAKAQTFNRVNTEYPEVMAYWIQKNS